jgi:hypothetical protein
VLTIRRLQMEVLERDLQARFAMEVVDHMADFAPWHFRVLGPDGTRLTVEKGLRRAGAHGLETRGAAQFYVELMFMFGSDFDTDPQLPWVAWFLTAPWLPEPTERVQKLFEKTQHYLRQVAGPNNRHAVDALRRLQVATTTAFPSSAGPMRQRMMDCLKWAYPEKCDYLGDSVLLDTVDRGLEIAHRHGCSDDESRSVFVVMAFAMGHGFADDPLFPWVSKTLRGPAGRPANDRVARLRRRAGIYLDRALKHVEGW